MTHITIFMSGFALSAGLIIAIGAQNLFVLRQGLRREHVGAIVLFCGFADALLIIIGVSGISAFLTALPQLTTILTICGAIFLIWYGIQAFKRVFSTSIMSFDEGAGMSRKQALITAATFTLLNPHVYLDTVLLMGAAGAAQPQNARVWFVFGAASASFTWFAALGFAARLLAPLFARPIAWKWLDGFVGVIMLLLAASLMHRAIA